MYTVCIKKPTTRGKKLKLKDNRMSLECDFWFQELINYNLLGCLTSFGDIEIILQIWSKGWKLDQNLT